MCEYVFVWCYCKTTSTIFKNFFVSIARKHDALLFHTFSVKKKQSNFGFFFENNINRYISFDERLYPNPIILVFVMGNACTYKLISFFFPVFFTIQNVLSEVHHLAIERLSRLFFHPLPPPKKKDKNTCAETYYSRIRRDANSAEIRKDLRSSKCKFIPTRGKKLLIYLEYLPPWSHIVFVFYVLKTTFARICIYKYSFLWSFLPSDRCPSFAHRSKCVTYTPSSSKGKLR